jgi:uncharacterized coiled-coil protein SlyX
MPNESLEVQLAVLSERFAFIKQELEEAKTARKSQYEKMEEQSVMMVNMDNRMRAVEISLTSQAPTIEEFITIKHKITGAGLAGHWVWKIGGGVLIVLCYFRTQIYQWLTKS